MKCFKQTYIAKMPDKAGAFLQASKIISRSGGNTVRVNYNKSVDAHTLFIEVNANEAQHREISELLSIIGYLTEELTEQKTILIKSLSRLPPTTAEFTAKRERLRSFLHSLYIIFAIFLYRYTTSVGNFSVICCAP